MKKDYLNSTDFNLWHTIHEGTEVATAVKPMLASFLCQAILCHQSLNLVLTYHPSSKPSSPITDVRVLFEVYQQALSADTCISKCVEADLKVIYERDPACDEYLLPLLYFKGFHAVQVRHINHQPYQDGRKMLAYFLQNRMSEVFGVDIHPTACFGYGLMLDHTTGSVAGEATTLDSNISILHGAMLGGSGKESGNHHPKIGDGVMIGASTSILGNIRIGKNAKISTDSVVVAGVPSSITVVGVPAEPVDHPSKTLSVDTDRNIQLSSMDLVV